MPGDNVDRSKIVEDVHVHSKISSIIEDPLVNPAISIIDESRVFCGYQ